eukprot:3330903-Prymnesium_polylepis.1
MALNEMVGTYTDGPLRGQRKPWNFHHIDERTARLTPDSLQGQVVKRHHKDLLRMPSWVYG